MNGPDFKVDDWKALMEQVKLYEEARTIQRGSAGSESFLFGFVRDGYR